MLKRISVILFLLITGLAVYWVYSPGIILFKILGYHFHEQSLPKGWDAMIRNYLPDILWAIAVNQTAILLTAKRFPTIYVYSLIALPFLSEISQYFGLLPGTFDLFDLLIYFFSFLVCCKPKLLPLCKTNSSIVSVH